MRIELNEIISGLGALSLSDRTSSTAHAIFAERVVNDSRQTTRDSVFVAIAGSKTDGRRFIRQAVENGGAAIFAENPLPPDIPADLSSPVFIVSDAYAAYARLAELFQGEPAKQLRLLSVTGTNGKTTTAFLLRSIIENWTEEPCGLISTVEHSSISEVRAAYRTTPDATEIQTILAETVASGGSNAVIEVSSHSLVQNRLGTAKFAVAVFTNLTGDHLDYHKTMDAYFDAKKLLFTRHLAENGTAVVNIDDSFGRKLAEELPDEKNVRVLTFGASDEASVRIVKANMSLFGMRFLLRFPNDAELAVESALCGSFNAANIAGAAAAAFAIEAPLSAIATGVANMSGVPGRMERCTENANVFVDYAHTDDALANILSMIRGLIDKEGEGGRLLVVFGCGGDRDKTKRPRMGAAAAEFADEIFVTSDNPRSEPPSAIIANILEGIPGSADVDAIEDRTEAIRQAVIRTRRIDALVIAGKGHETYQEIDGERIPFSDRGTVLATLAR
ncbi:MAG: UDP-N-acetylmuramoyl-L-alanyl-D-glutamate--2,6-diaminopimelate ligase [Victivallales bacterium]|nr:UDP-N-acetylmuramoyl-L-alanyl-D-glutamate--2,6-diaminopimelate ligase [Victivallales bacterium]